MEMRGTLSSVASKAALASANMSREAAAAPQSVSVAASAFHQYNLQLSSTLSSDTTDSRVPAPKVKCHATLGLVFLFLL